MNPVLLAIGACVAVAVSLVVLYAYRRAEAVSVARRRVVPTATPAETATSALRSVTTRVPLADHLPLSGRARASMEAELERAAAPLRTSEYVALRVVMGLGLGVAGAFALRGIEALAVPAALALVVVGWQVPKWYVTRLARRRLDAIEEQIPSALMAIAKSLRAGSGLLQALAFAAEETPAPLGDELTRTLRELRLGADPETVFTALSERVGSDDLDIAVTAILIQRSVGGNLAEILANVTNTVRERAQLHAEVKVLTTRQRVTANLMAGMPVAVAIAFVGLNPDTGRLLVETFAGQVSLALGVVFEVAGLLLIRRLGVIEV